MPIHVQESVQCRPSGELVCHFTSYETAVKHILEPQGDPVGMYLKLGTYRNVNDPRENHLSIDNFYWHTESQEQQDPSFPDIRAAIGHFKAMLLDHCKVLCTTEDRFPDGSQPLHTRAFGRPRMWSQYGGGRKGICLVLNKLAITEAIHVTRANQPFYEGPVSYDLAGRTRSRAYREIDFRELETSSPRQILARQLSQFQKEFFFCKDPDWSNESEYRWVVLATDAGDAFVRIDDALVGVVLGEHASALPEPLATRLAQANIPVGRILWNPGLEDLQLVGEQ